MFRDVPKPEDVKSEGSYATKIAPNAEALIDFALSHIPQSKLYCNTYTL